MASRFTLFLIALAWSSFVQAGPKEDALAAYENFFKSYTSGNHDKVAALFAPDALVQNIYAPKTTSGSGALAHYKSLLGRPGEVKATPLEQNALLISDSVVAITGLWQVETTIDGKSSTNQPTRLSVVMQKHRENWLIVLFHNAINLTISAPVVVPAPRPPPRPPDVVTPVPPPKPPLPR